MTSWSRLLRIGLCALSTLVTAFAASAETAPIATQTLADYVAQPDEVFGWKQRSNGFLGNTHYTEYILTSQTWRGTPWQHQLYLIIPATLMRDTQHALLIIAGSRWKEELNQSPERASLPSSANVYARMAELAATPVAVIQQVPFQPMFNDLTEDRLIAHTFEKYLETGDTTWPLLLPMVKSAVRAMDATQALMTQEWKMDIRTFTVTGASKRGWTTWLTGAVDDRVTALAPMVIDMVNIRPQMEHARAVWGGPSTQIKPYTDRGLLDRLASPEGKSLLQIVDPFSYRKLLTKPKLIINGTNDAYWPVDATQIYWDDLPGQKHLMFVPNTGHSLQDYSRVTASLLALHQSQFQKRPMPEFAWEFEESPDAVTISVRANPAPYQFKIWTASRPTADFRSARWISTPLLVGDGKVRHTVARTAEHQGVFVEAEFRDGRPLPLNLTTVVRVIPPSGAAPNPNRTANTGTAVPSAPDK